MLSIHLAFADEGTRQRLTAFIRAAGLPLGEAHAAAAPIIRSVRRRDGGLVLCSEMLPDMSARQLQDALGEDARVIVLQRVPGVSPLQDEGPLHLPLSRPPGELAGLLWELLGKEEERRRLRRQPRTEDEEILVRQAKCCLMSRLNISESQAHKLLQQISMRQGLRMAQAAREILKS